MTGTDSNQGAAGADDNSEMVVIKRYAFQADAELERSVLENAGIEAAVFADSTFGFSGVQKAGVRLVVAGRDVDEACEVLNISDVPKPAASSIDWTVFFFVLLAALAAFALYGILRGSD